MRRVYNNKKDSKWDEIIIKTPNIIMTKKDVFDYYSNPKIRNSILQDIGKNPVIVIQNFKWNKPVLKRNEAGSKIKITGFGVDENNPSDLMYWLKRRTVEFHKTLENPTNQYIVDIDPNEVDPSVSINVVNSIKNILLNLPEVQDAHIRYSGGRGYYVIADLKNKIDINEARNRLKQVLSPLVSDIVTFSVPYKGQIRIDLSPMKRGGSIRALGSLNSKTGFQSHKIML